MNNRISVMLLAVIFTFATSLFASATYVATDDGYIKMDTIYDILSNNGNQ
ncbi:MAG: hypothetical protein KKD38_06750 [Candidatus Delongbacteria bacterium]|nr:hypothetical protein [Candidatus Delongbacteria bacterium]MCG2760835.1 hypothetical protein [Candidatus Delongbacteria bacterium]